MSAIEELSDLDRQLEQLDVLGVQALIRQGIEIEAFLRSPTGSTLIEKAKGAQMQAVLAMAEVNPLDSQAVVQAQMDCRIPRLVLEWICEALGESANAERELINADQSRG